MSRTLILALLFSAAAAHAEDLKGSHDYPLIQRFPHVHIDAYEERAWDQANSLDARGQNVRIEGRTVEIGYGIDKGEEKPSALEVIRNYENALRGGGWTLLLREKERLSAKLDKGGREVWTIIDYDANWAHIRFRIVEKGPMPILIEPGKAQARKSARPDVAKGKDFAGIPRLPHEAIGGFEEKKFDEFDFRMADGSKHHAEGHKLQISYDPDKLPDGVRHPSIWHAMQSYRAVLEGESWVVVFQDSGRITAMLRDGDKETWAEIVYDQGWGTERVIVVEPGEFKQVVDANSLLDRLKAEGKLSFDIHFDTGNDVIKPESQPVLAQMIEVFKTDPELKAEIGGHTDNTGSEADNLGLSQRRATAVMTALRTAGIDAARLTAKGYGQSKPLADNGSTGGRALNRRVELVRR